MTVPIERDGAGDISDELVTRSCVGSVAEVLARLRNELKRRGIQLFAVIDHAHAARNTGLELSDEVVVIFGNPAAGTPLMQQNARTGIDLPLRMLIWDDEGTTTTAFTPPTALGRRFSLDPTGSSFRQMAALLNDLAAAISR